MIEREFDKMSRPELLEVLRRLLDARDNDERLRATIHDLEVHRDELHANQIELAESQHLLELSRDAYAALFDFAPISYLILDASGMVVDLNIAGATLFGAERARLVGYPFVTFVAPEHRKVFLDYMRQCRARARGTLMTAEIGNFETELTLQRRDQLLIPVLITAKRMTASSRRSLSEFHMAIVDLTDRKRLEAQRLRSDQERQLAEQQEQLARTESQTKDHFIAVLSHELRTPLAPIRFAVASLRRAGVLPDALRRALDIIDRNVEHEARMIEDLLDVSRIAQGKLRLMPNRVDLHRVGEEVVVSHAEELERAGLRLRFEPRATAFHVWGDEGRLRQVVTNLVRNACTNTSSGGHVTVATANPSPDRVEMTVRDDGRGIAHAVLSRLFRPFEQHNDPERSRGGGLGLGLSICKGIMEAHGGRVSAASEGPGTGATFTLELPALAIEDVLPAPPETVEPEPADVAPARDGIRVLLVEDNVDNAESMAALLEMFGYRVRIAGSVHEALQAAEDDFDVLVSDIGLPDGTGRDLMRELSARRPVRGIALTGYGTPEDVLHNAHAGFSRHLVKPVDPDKLVAMIDEVMQARAHRRTGSG